MSDRRVFLLVGVLLLATAALCLLQWWQADELGSINRRVNELELARRKRRTAGTANHEEGAK